MPIFSKMAYSEQPADRILMKEGDVIRCEKGVEHWHSSSAESDVSYVDIYGSSPTTWTQKLSREAYHAVAHTVEEFSDLAVMVWIQDNSTKEIYQSVELTQSAVGLDETFVPRIGLYPNPANDFVTMDFRGVKDTSADYRIINALGQTVSAGILDLNETRLPNVNTSSFTPGLYFVVWSSDSHKGSETLHIAR
jgi:hypothetical protein